MKLKRWDSVSRPRREAAAVLVELSIAFMLLILLIGGAVVVSSSSREHSRIVQITGAIGKTIVRDCSDELRNAGTRIQECLDGSSANVLEHGKLVLDDFKVVVSVYDDSAQPAARIAFSEVSTPGSTVAAEQSRHSPVSVSTKFANLLGSAGVAVVIEVFAPAKSVFRQIRRWFAKDETVVYEGLVL
jgi:hypothetical protein